MKNFWFKIFFANHENVNEWNLIFSSLYEKKYVLLLGTVLIRTTSIRAERIFINIILIYDSPVDGFLWIEYLNWSRVTFSADSKSVFPFGFRTEVSLTLIDQNSYRRMESIAICFSDTIKIELEAQFWAMSETFKIVSHTRHLPKLSPVQTGNYRGTMTCL